MYDWDDKPELNITPLVDVMLVLLAILMVISPNIVYEELINLPKGSAQTEVKEKKEIEILINGSKQIKVNNQVFDVMNVMSAVKRSGLTNISLATSG